MITKKKEIVMDGITAVITYKARTKKEIENRSIILEIVVEDAYRSSAREEISKYIYYYIVLEKQIRDYKSK